MQREVWTALWLALTSDTGKLSALGCRADGDSLDVLAVERHFEVALHLTPYKRKSDNFEGVVWLGDGSVALILDNDSGSISGPNTLILAPL